jgi:hypothetical protein
MLKQAPIICISKVHTTNQAKNHFHERKKEIHMQRNQSIHIPSTDMHKGKERRECIKNITKKVGKQNPNSKSATKRDVNNPPNCG